MNANEIICFEAKNKFLNFFEFLSMLLSKVTGESHCKKWSYIANSWAFLIRFLVRFEVPMSADALVKKMLKYFSVISSLPVTTRIAVGYSREDFLIKDISESERTAKLASGSKSNIKLTKLHIFFHSGSKSAFKSIEDFAV